MIAILDGALVSFAGILFLYLAVLSALSLVRRNRTVCQPHRCYRFAVIVPAHNEESGIAGTLWSILRADYPHLWFDVVVVADNCSDRTADIARGLGAVVYERNDENHRGKGYALSWCFDRLLNESPPYDAFVVVDADTRVGSNILTVMSGYLENGAKVIQCADVVQPRPGVWSSEITRLGFLLYNVARPLGRSVLGFSAGLRGNGMCFSSDILRGIPWNAHSLAEDLEYSLILVLNSQSVVFAPEARVVATMPVNPRNAESQRARWETGRYPLVRAYAGRLFAMALRKRSLIALDALIDLVTPPIVNLFAFSLLMFMIHLVIAWFDPSWAVQMGLWWLLVISLGAGHVLLGLIASEADRDLYKTLLAIPRYMLWKLGLYIKLLRNGRVHTWIRTTREGRDHAVQASRGNEAKLTWK